MTILIVEDEEPMARIFCRALTSHGFEAEYVGDGKAALSILERRPPEMIVVDLGLPGCLNGIEVAQRARAQGYAGPIVLMSGAVDVKEDGIEDHISKETTGIEFAGKLLKPIRLEELICLVEQLTGRPAERQEIGERVGPVGG